MGGAKQERIQPPHPFPSCQAEGLSSASQLGSPEQQQQQQ